MKESRVYLNFFQNSFWIIISLTILGGLATYIVFGWYPQTFTESDLLIMLYNQDNMQNRITLADQAVSLLRTPQIQSELSLDSASQVTVYKMAPLAITIDVSNKDQKKAIEDVNKLEKYSTFNFPLVRAGVIRVDVKNYLTVFMEVAGVLVGALIGVLISLLKFYFKNY